MDSKEMLYEISLKYNTLKMYENTIDQMKKNGISNEDSLAKIISEKEAVEKELQVLLNPSTPIGEGYRTNPKTENAFLKEADKTAKCIDMYKGNGSFFDDISKNEIGWSTIQDTPEDTKDEIEEKKPTFSEIQDKIGNSQWISASNFIAKFPKEVINIDEWRVSGVNLEFSKPYCTLKNVPTVSGKATFIVNDFADKVDDNEYNILMESVVKLYRTCKAVNGFNIYIETISNNGDLLYTTVLKDCEFSEAWPASYDYQSTELRKIGIIFKFSDVIILAPNEELRKNETTY